jgi:3-oxoacyl-[acyl-carrier protein] reductase
MDLGLQGKVALLPAATRGLGFALAETLIQEGARVLICGRKPDRTEQALAKLRQAGGTNAVTGLTADITEHGVVEQLVNQTVEQFGRLDIVVTNAAGPPGGTFDSTDAQAWEMGLELTLMSAVRLIRAGLPYLRQSDAPSILTMTSISVVEPIAGLMLSNVIRPAVAALTKNLARELGPEGIRANSILPGWTATDRVEEIFQYRARTKGSSVEEERALIVKDIPMGRMARPEEFGRVAAFLVSPAASYVNGVMLLVDGGSYRGLM